MLIVSHKKKTLLLVRRGKLLVQTNDFQRNKITWRVFVFLKNSHLMEWYAFASRPSTRLSPITTTRAVWRLLLFFSESQLPLKASIFSLSSVRLSASLMFLKAFLRLNADDGFLTGGFSPSPQWLLSTLLSFDKSNTSLSLLPSSMQEFEQQRREKFNSRSPSGERHSLDRVTRKPRRKAWTMVRFWLTEIVVVVPRCKLYVWKRHRARKHRILIFWSYF